MVGCEGHIETTMKAKYFLLFVGLDMAAGFEMDFVLLNHRRLLDQRLYITQQLHLFPASSMPEETSYQPLNLSQTHAWSSTAQAAQ